MRILQTTAKEFNSEQPTELLQEFSLTTCDDYYLKMAVGPNVSASRAALQLSSIVMKLYVYVYLLIIAPVLSQAGVEYGKFFLFVSPPEWYLFLSSL